MNDETSGGTSGETSHARLLPWTGAHGQACLLVTDGDGAVSRIADRAEDVQLGLAQRLLVRAREVVAMPELSAGELGELTVQLVDALHDALLIAGCRSARLAWAEQSGVREQDGTPGARPTPVEAVVRLTLPGHDRASAGVARRHVRDTARSWGLPSGATDDLETITGELVANAVEHSGSHAITITCALSARSATVSVTDGGGGRQMPVAPAVPPPPDQEHGRGLLITDALADRWGTRRAGGELTVWAEVGIESLDSPEIAE
ncbi:ATP-binding protein [Streptomyces sp. NPDC005263]|uniref:ATP-binding protein n=1 Tax=Streptomyces sp. NPDC005263 TaxID=3364711 RepID=UPI0036C64015